MLYQRCYDLLVQLRSKEAARSWKSRFRALFIRSHWILPYPQADRFIKRQNHQPLWWSSYHADVSRYYQTEAIRQQGLSQPLPATDVDHYPVEGWNLADKVQFRMPYILLPKQDLAHLTDDEIYDQMNEFAHTDPPTDTRSDPYSIQRFIEPIQPIYAITGELNGNMEPDRVYRLRSDRIRNEYGTLKQLYRRLRYPGWTRSNQINEDLSDENTDIEEETSDEEALDRQLHQTQIQLPVKQQELEDTLKQEDQEEKIRQQHYQQAMQRIERRNRREHQIRCQTRWQEIITDLAKREPSYTSKKII